MTKSIIYSKPSKVIFVLLTVACIIITYYAGTKIKNEDTETKSLHDKAWFITLIGGIFLSFALLIASTGVVLEVKSLM